MHRREHFEELETPLGTERLLAFTDRHAVTALLAWHLKMSGRLEVLTPALAGAFTAAFHASIARSYTQLAELARVLEGLKAAGIAAIPWKGPPLAHRIFMEAASRESHDLDILMAPECLPDAGLVLRNLGYLPVNGESDVRAILEEDHCATFRHATRPVTIELHGQPFPSSYPFALAFGEMKLATDSPRRIGGNEFPAMATEWELLLSAAHAAKHLWFRLSWIADIARIAREMSADEAAALHRLACQSRCHRVIQISLLLAEDLLRAEIPPHLKALFHPTPQARRMARTIRQRILDPDATPEGTSARPTEWVGTQLLRMRSREALGDQVHIAGCILRYILSPNSNDQDLFPGVRLPKFLALFSRPIRLFASYTLHLQSR